MVKNFSAKLNLCRYFIIGIAILGGLTAWFQKPEIIRIHIDPIRYGSKHLFLPILLLPLLALIPHPSNSEFHVDDEESRLAIEKEKTDTAIIRLAMAVLLAGVVLWIMVMV